MAVASSVGDGAVSRCDGRGLLVAVAAVDSNTFLTVVVAELRAYPAAPAVLLTESGRSAPVSSGLAANTQATESGGANAAWRSPRPTRGSWPLGLHPLLEPLPLGNERATLEGGAAQLFLPRRPVPTDWLRGTFIGVVRGEGKGMEGGPPEWPRQDRVAGWPRTRCRSAGMCSRSWMSDRVRRRERLLMGQHPFLAELRVPGGRSGGARDGPLPPPQRRARRRWDGGSVAARRVATATGAGFSSHGRHGDDRGCSGGLQPRRLRRLD